MPLAQKQNPSWLALTVPGRWSQLPGASRRPTSAAQGHGVHEQEQGGGGGGDEAGACVCSGPTVASQIDHRTPVARNANAFNR